MPDKNQYELDFEQYIRNTEPDKNEKTYVWSTAIGLQKVDGLTPSKYLFETAKRSIDGDITFNEANTLINSYYESKKDIISDSESRTEEADKVASRIAQILSEKSFNFSPSYLISLHGRLFEGIFNHSGVIRNYDISKHEWVLGGDSVLYGAAFELKAALDYDFEQERKFNYSIHSKEEIADHISFFISRLWQIHPFAEGNTRTTAVFIIKYLHSLGFNVNNDIFAENAWYFRNALVRANYQNIQKGIQQNPEFLERFFRNLLLNENNELKNRYCHINAENLPVNKKNLPVNLPVNKTQKQILSLLKANPNKTYDDLAEEIGKTRETIRVNLRKLEDLGLIRRVGSDKTGHWVTQL